MKKVRDKGSFSGQQQPKTTQAEEEVLILLTKEFLTTKQIAIRRQTSTRAVQKIIKRIKEKGLLNIGFQEVRKKRTCPRFRRASRPKLRLHAQEFNVRILYKGRDYRKSNKGNTILVDGNTVRLYKNSIEIYSGQSWYGNDVNRVTAESFEYWNKFLAKLEHRLKVILVKPHAQNITLVNEGHYAETNNEIAQECDKKKHKVKIFTRDDGKLWFTIDNSFNLHEAECLHPATAKGDMQQVREHFNDLRDNKVLPLSKISEIVSDTAKQINEVSHGLKSVVTIMKSQLPKDQEEGKKTPQSRPDYIH